MTRFSSISTSLAREKGDAVVCPFKLCSGGYFPHARHTALGWTLALLLLCVTSPATSGAEKVAWAGLAFSGSDISGSSRFSFATNELFLAELNERLGFLLKANPPRHYELKLDRLADFEKGETVSLACVLDGETVVEERSGDGWIIIISLQAQAMWIDFSRGGARLRGSRPFLVHMIDYLDHKPTHTELTDRVRLGFVDPQNKETVLEHFAAIVRETPMNNNKLAASVQVRQVNLDDRALSVMPQHYRSQPDVFKAYLAGQFGAQLAKNHGLSVLPYAKDATIGKMALRFTTRNEVLNLEIPKASYCFDLDLQGFKRVLHKETAAERAYIYGCFFKVRFYQELLGKDYLNEEAKQGYARVFPRAKEPVDWLGYETSLTDFSREYTRKLGQDSKQHQIKEAFAKCKI